MWTRRERGEDEEKGRRTRGIGKGEGSTRGEGRRAGRRRERGGRTRERGKREREGRDHPLNCVIDDTAVDPSISSGL